VVVVEVAAVMTMTIAAVTVTEVLKRGDIENKEAGLHTATTVGMTTNWNNNSQVLPKYKCFELFLSFVSTKLIK